MELPDISIIVPTKNRPAFLRQAVTSILNQCDIALEVLVIDDGQGASEAVAGLDRRLRVIDNRGRGPVPARILGVNEARGRLIGFLDDDDWFLDRQYLASAADLIGSGAGLVFCDGLLKFEAGKPDEVFAFDADRHSLEANNTILISGVVYRHDLHDNLGRFDESLPYYWDWDWYLRVARAGHALTRISRAAVAIRVHASNMSGPEQEAARRANLDRFSAKHGLPAIPLKNHLSLAREARGSG